MEGKNIVKSIKLVIERYANDVYMKGKIKYV